MVQGPGKWTLWEDGAPEILGRMGGIDLLGEPPCSTSTPRQPQGVERARGFLKAPQWGHGRAGTPVLAPARPRSPSNHCSSVTLSRGSSRGRGRQWASCTPTMGGSPGHSDPTLLKATLEGSDADLFAKKQGHPGSGVLSCVANFLWAEPLSGPLSHQPWI